MIAPQYHSQVSNPKLGKGLNTLQKYRRVLALLIILIEITKNVIVKLVYLGVSLKAGTISIFCSIVLIPIMYFSWVHYSFRRGLTEKDCNKYIDYMMAIYITGCTLSYQLDFVYIEGQQASNYEWFVQGAGLAWILLLQEFFIGRLWLRTVAPTSFIICWFVLGYVKNEEDGGAVALRIIPQWIYIMLIYLLQIKLRSLGHNNIVDEAIYEAIYSKEALDIVPDNIILLDADGKTLFCNATCQVFCESKALTLAELFIYISNIEQRSCLEGNTTTIAKVDIKYIK